MALFKISKGLKANLPVTYNEGYCYFTTDDGKMYIDTKDNDSTGRVCLNAARADVATKADSATKLTTERTINGLKFNGTSNINNYGVCSTAAATVAKTVTVGGTFVLETGAFVIVKFDNANSAANPTLNVNGTGAKKICQYGSTAVSTGTSTTGWRAGSVQIFVYDGANWIRDYWSNTTYNTDAVQCTTAAATAAKVGTTSYYNLATSKYFVVMMRYSNTYQGALTLNISSKGAKPIYINGTASSASNYTLPLGLYIVYYDGTNYHFRTDGKIPGTVLNADKLTTNAGSATNPVYFANGIPVATTHTLGKSVPSDAKFTDTTYSAATQSTAGLMSAADKTKLDGIATGATANTGDITGVTAGKGLTGGGTSGSVTLNVGAGAGLTVADDSIGHTNSVTAKTTYNQATATPGYSGKFKITEPKYDAQGHITEVQVAEITMPSAQTLSSLGITATATELNYTDGVTSNIQTQLNSINAELDAIDWFKKGTAIPDGSDLDTYNTPGKYYINSGSSSGTLVNCPVTNDNFALFVFARTSSNSTSLAQMIITLGSHIYLRNTSSNGEWRDWFKMAKYTEMTSYADSVGETVKNDLLNGAGAAYDTLKELADLIIENDDAIEALNTLIAERTITAGNGLTGGGNLSANRTLNVGAGAGISVTADAVALATSGVTAGTYGPSANVSGSGASITIPQFAIDAYGRVTAASSKTYTGPTIDSAMNSTSTNPVQNKVIKAYIDGKVPNMSAYLPKSAGEAHKLTGALGLTENVMYGTELPATGFDGQLFFLEDDSVGLPTGGNAGHVLIKNSDTYGDASWKELVALPKGGTEGQVLVKNSTTDGDAYWSTDINGNAATASTLAQIKLTGNPSDESEIGYRLVASINVTTWSNRKAVYSLRSRHSGNGILSIACGCNSGTISEDTVYCDIVLLGWTGTVTYNDAWVSYYDSTNSQIHIFWKYQDYNSTILSAINVESKYINLSNNGAWMTSIPSTYGIQLGTYKKAWIQGDAVTGAVWNDYAECRESDCEEFGYVLMENGDDTLSKTTERLSHFAGISSDTWGFSQGETDKAKTPIAVAGRVLAYPYQDRDNYKPGDCVCAAPGGTVDIMTREEIINWPDRIVGTVSCVPDYEEWGGGKNADRDSVKVNGRIWIKVR